MNPTREDLTGFQNLSGLAFCQVLWSDYARVPLRVPPLGGLVPAKSPAKTGTLYFAENVGTLWAISTSRSSARQLRSHLCLRTGPYVATDRWLISRHYPDIGVETLRQHLKHRK